MSQILYLNNKYINSLETLRNLIVIAVKDDSPLLYKEVETLFKDRIIHKWLEEGDIECHKVLSSLILIPDNIDSSKLKEKIGMTFAPISVSRSISFLARANIQNDPVIPSPILYFEKSIYILPSFLLRSANLSIALARI